MKMVMKLRSLIFTAFLILPGVFFLYTGYQWLVSPEAAASTLMMPLLGGAALSSQIGDIGGLSLGMGLVVMGAVVTRKGDWLMPLSIILACIGIYRLLAFSLHDASLTLGFALAEIVLSIWFGLASRKLSGEESTDAS